MVAVLLLLTTLQQTPPPFAEVELDKVRAYHDLKLFHEEMTCTLTAGPNEVKIERSTFIDGSKFHCIQLVNATQRYESICDGSREWTISRPDRQYGDVAADTAFDPTAEVIKATNQHFYFRFDSDRPAQFACDPDFTPVSMETVTEGKDKLRKLVYSAVSKTGHTMTMTEWFLPDRWILKKVLLIGQSDVGDTRLECAMSTLDFEPTMPPDVFKLDPAIVDGYKKIDGTVSWPIGR